MQEKQLGVEFDVVCVGSALLDIYMKSDKFVKVHTSQVKEGVVLGEVYGGKTEVTEAELASGGGGTNNAVSFARKGYRTALIAEMGDDLIGAVIKEELMREKVNGSMLVMEKSEDTGVSAIMVSAEGGRSVSVYRGASKMLTKADVHWDRLYPRWLHISSLGGEMSLLEGLIGHAKTYGIRVSVNPGMSELEKVDGWGGLRLFENVDLLLLNREEAGFLLGKNFNDDEEWQRVLSVYGPKMTVISDGSRSGRVCMNGECQWYSVESVPMVQQTGAGDAFGTGIVTALMEGKDAQTAISWGKKQAASVVSFMGPKKGLLSLEEISR